MNLANLDLANCRALHAPRLPLYIPVLKVLIWYTMPRPEGFDLCNPPGGNIHTPSSLIALSLGYSRTPPAQDSGLEEVPTTAT